MKILSKVQWDHALTEENGELYLTVICGTVGIFDLKIRLNEDEIRRYRIDSDYIQKLANSIRDAPSSYESRRLKVQ